MTNRIFISYRREDSRGSAGRIYDHLAAHFGREQIFMDVDTIQPGLDFVDAIHAAVGKVDVLIAVIGPAWLSAADAGGRRRLDQPEDFVRLEIATALERDIRVIPVLVEGALPPSSAELPDNLKPLARRNAIEISHNRFSSDVQRLVHALKLTLDENKGTFREGERSRPGSPSVESAPGGGASSGVLPAGEVSGSSKYRTETNSAKPSPRPFERSSSSPRAGLQGWQKIFANDWVGIGLPVLFLAFYCLMTVALTCANPDAVIIAEIVGFPISIFSLAKKQRNYSYLWLGIAAIIFVISMPHGGVYGSMSRSAIFNLETGDQCQFDTYEWANILLLGQVFAAALFNFTYLSLIQRKNP